MSRVPHTFSSSFRFRDDILGNVHGIMAEATGWGNQAWTDDMVKVLTAITDSLADHASEWTCLLSKKPLDEGDE